jgi:hypothetical protein
MTIQRLPIEPAWRFRYFVNGPPTRTGDSARRTLMPAQRLSSWPYNATALRLPIEAPNGTHERTRLPPARVTDTARVRRPRESKISIADIDEN